MSFDLKSISRQAIVGGFCGLLGWIAIRLLSVSSATSIGLLLGLCLSAGQPIRQVLLNGRSVRQISARLPIAVVAGLLSGVVGVHIGEFLFQQFDYPIWPRAIGWGVFGLGIGTASGLIERSTQSRVFGAIGGLIGGLLGGSSYEAIASAAVSSGITRSLAIAFGGSLGLTVLGLCIGGMIALVELVLCNALFRILNGARAGQMRTLSSNDSELVIGRSENCDLCIRGDQSIAGKHVSVLGSTSGFFARAIESSEITVIRGGKKLTHSEVALNDGDLICIGETQARFQLSQLR